MALPARGGVFRAASYDELVDSPFECGTHRTFDFRVRGVPHTLAIWGSGNEDAARLTRDLKKLVLEAAALFGGLPYERYLFLVHLALGRARGPRAPRLPVRRVRPVGVPAREGVPRDAPPLLARALPRVERQAHPARGLRSVRLHAGGPHEGSLGPGGGHVVLRGPPRRARRPPDAGPGLRGVDDVAGPAISRRRAEPSRARRWRPSTPGSASTVPTRTPSNVAESYYRRGQLLGLALDLALRGATSGRRGLDDVMRLLWRRYGSKGRGYPDGAVEDAVARDLRVARARAPVLRPLRPRHGDARSRAAPGRRGPRAEAGARVRGGRHGDGLREDARGLRMEDEGRERTRLGGRGARRRCGRAGRREPGRRNRGRRWSTGDRRISFEGKRPSAGPRARVSVSRVPPRRLLLLRLTLGARKAGVWKVVPLPKAAPAVTPAREALARRRRQRLKKP